MISFKQGRRSSGDELSGKHEAFANSIHDPFLSDFDPAKEQAGPGPRFAPISEAYELTKQVQDSIGTLAACAERMLSRPTART